MQTLFYPMTNRLSQAQVATYEARCAAVVLKLALGDVHVLPPKPSLLASKSVVTPRDTTLCNWQDNGVNLVFSTLHCFMESVICDIKKILGSLEYLCASQLYSSNLTKRNNLELFQNNAMASYVGGAQETLEQERQWITWASDIITIIHNAIHDLLNVDPRMQTIQETNRLYLLSLCENVRKAVKDLYVAQTVSTTLEVLYPKIEIPPHS